MIKLLIPVRLSGACIALVSGLVQAPLSGATIPETASELSNRVFVRTAPNGSQQAWRFRAGQSFEPSGGYRTNWYGYTRAGLAPDQALLLLASTDTFSGVYSWQTNRFLLSFATPTEGTYALDFTIHSVPGIQQSAGTFQLTEGDNILPRINQQPSGAALPAGQNISALAVGVIGFDLKYQWYHDHTPVPGAVQSSYAFLPMNADKVGDWWLVVSNSIGAVTSSIARIELATQPLITRQPTPATAYEGGTVTLSVEATGGALSYEWLFKGSFAGLPNSPSVTLTNLSSARAGLYSVRISNNAGSVISSQARVTVSSPTLNATWGGRPWVRIAASGDPVAGTQSTLGPLSGVWQPLFALRDETLHLVLRANSETGSDSQVQRGLFEWRAGVLTPLVFTNTPRPDSGYFTDVFYPTETGDGAVNFASGGMFELRNNTLREVIGTNTPAPGRPLRLGGPGSFARRGSRVLISASLFSNESFFPAGQGLYLHDGAALSRICDDSTDLPGVMPGYMARPSEDAVNLDDQTLVFSTVSGTGIGGMYRATMDGRITKLLDTGDLLPGLTNAVLGFGDIDVEGGMVFGVVTIKVGTSSTQNRVVGFEPDGRVILIGTGDYLVAGGPRQVYYGTSSAVNRWTDGLVEPLLNTGSILDGRRISQFTDVEAHGDNVAVGVTFQDGVGGVFANFGRSASGPPRVLVQPKSATAPASTPATYSIAATGTAPLAYQWRKDGTPIPGATSPVLVVGGTTADSLGNYDVLVTNSEGSVQSEPASLTLTDPPVVPMIHTQPASVALPVGDTALLSVLASGAPPLAYLWRLEGVPIDGATGTTLDVQVRTNARYTVVVANRNGSITSFVASVSAQPRILRHPQDVTATPGATASFTVEATGFATLTYLWFKGTSVLVGQTNATLTLTNIQAAQAGSYSVNISGLGGSSVRSKPAALVVDTAVPIVLGAPVRVNDRLTIAVPTQLGRQYRVEFSPSISPPAWNQQQTLTGTGTAMTFELAPTGTAGFVRVVELP